MPGKPTIIKEVALILVPLAILLVMVAILLTEAFHIGGKFEDQVVTASNNEAQAIMTSFFMETIHIYDQLRRWVISGSVAPINTTVQDNAVGSTPPPPDWTHLTFELGAYDMVLSHPYIDSLYFADSNLNTLLSGMHPGSLYTTSYYQYSAGRGRQKTLHWGESYQSAVLGAWQNVIYDPSQTSWWQAAINTHGPANFSTNEGGQPPPNVGSASSMVPPDGFFIYDDVFAWSGPNWETFRDMRRNRTMTVPVMDLSFRINWPENVGAGKFAIFRVEMNTGIIDQTLEDITLPAKGAVCLVHKDGRVLNTNNHGDNYRVNPDGTETFLKAWETAIPGVSQLAEADLADARLDQGESVILTKGGYIILVNPQAVTRSWRLVVALKRTDILWYIGAYTVAVNAVAAIAFILIIVRGALAIYFIVKEAKHVVDHKAHAQLPEVPTPASS